MKTENPLAELQLVQEGVRTALEALWVTKDYVLVDQILRGLDTRCSVAISRSNKEFPADTKRERMTL